MKKLSFFLFCLLIIAFSSQTYAQKKKVIPTGTTVVVILKDGSQVNGKLVAEDAESVVIETESMGKVTVEKVKIRSPFL